MRENIISVASQNTGIRKASMSSFLCLSLWLFKTSLSFFFRETSTGLIFLVQQCFDRFLVVGDSSSTQLVAQF